MARNGILRATAMARDLRRRGDQFGDATRMDASFIAPTPPAPPGAGVEAAPETQSDDAAAFAAHLPPQDAPARPASRRATAKATQPEAESAQIVAQPTSFTLSSPSAPVTVRLDATPGLIDVSFTPSPVVAELDTASVALDAELATASTPLLTALSVAPQVVATTVAAVAAPAPKQDSAPVAATPIAAADPAVAAAPIAQTETAPAPAPAPPAEFAATVATPTKPPAEPPHTAGRPRGGDRAEAAPADAPRAGATAQPIVAVAQAGARAGASRDAPSPGSSPVGGETAPQTGAIAETSSGESRRLADAAPPPVHRPPTPAATVAQHIVRRFEGQATTIEVRLDPSELGAVHVKLDVGADARVTAVVAADNPATLADLMRSARDLERALESAGLELASGGLSFDLSDRRSASDADADGDGASAASAGAGEDAEAAAAPASRPFGLEAWRGVRVDMTV